MPGQFATIEKVAQFLGTETDTVTRLLKEGRLDSALLVGLRQRGVQVTPALKNSVRAQVKTIKRPEVRSSAGAPSPSAPGLRRTTTIMFTDLVGSTTVMDRLGDRDSRALFSQHDQIIRQRAATFEGREVKSLGDGFMLTFPSTRHGIFCALGVQRSLAEHNEANPANPMYVRIGMSVGEPVQDSQDPFGMAVNLAARITAEAEGGQVLVCEIVRALASSSKELRFRSLGQFELKGIDGERPLYEVLWSDS